jgi:hypothetical protein
MNPEGERSMGDGEAWVSAVSGRRGEPAERKAESEAGRESPQGSSAGTEQARVGKVPKTGEKARGTAQEDPLKKRRVLLDKLAELRSGSNSGTAKFEEARRRLEEEIIVTKPQPGAEGMVPSEVEDLTNRRLAAEIESRGGGITDKMGEEPAVGVAEGEPVAKLPPLPESLPSWRFDPKEFGRALSLPDAVLLPSGKESKKVGSEIFAGLEANIFSALGREVGSGSLAESGYMFPEGVVGTEGKLRWARERATEQARETLDREGLRSGSLVLLQALRKSGLTYEEALRVTVHAATRQAMRRARALFPGGLKDTDPADSMYPAISGFRAGDKHQVAEIADTLTSLLARKRQELERAALQMPRETV